ncbi:GNAT family N-acetyltransferase [Lentibacillus salicampi]|uniref:GNAT family N-acetyltransferase n=1 Tax=Lentibacillus salicampi TaxID=175306 RepID=A0A4Y9A7M2_9BACI|nr:GNAT family N-acetyltransferase [Lentibacillus salicampi]TFJ91455.1 GNAT family N-acetyltransferase [Lentibacillus salicampi]
MAGLFKMDTFNTYMIRKAEADDAETVIGILRDAAEWLVNRGIHQWDFYLTEEAASEIREAIKAGTTYLVTDNTQPVATFNLSQLQNDLDVSIWGNRHDDALYLHRLAVNINYRRQKIGKQLLEWIMENSPADCEVLRLDCVADNPGLNQFYIDAGFIFSGHADAMAIQFSRYEKPLHV